MVTLIDRNRQWFKSRIGQEDPETSRDVAFCAHAILEEDLFVVEDAARDERFHDNPLVTGDPHIRFYAGAPLQTRDGFSLGTLCVIDRVPRALTDVQSDCLRRLARQVVVHFEQRRKIAEQERFKAQLEEVVDLQNAIFNSANFSIIATEIDGTIRGFNAGAERMLGYRAEELVSKTSPAIFHDGSEVAKRAAELSAELGKPVEAGFETFIAKSRLGLPDEREWIYVRKDKSRFPVLLSVTPVYAQSGTLRGYLGIGRDIAEQKDLEKQRDQMMDEIRRTNTLLSRELETTQEKYRYLVEGSNEIIFSADLSGKILSMNQSIRTLGFKPADVIGKTLQELAIEDDLSPNLTADVIEEGLQRLPSSKRESFVATFRTSAGESLDMQLTLEIVNLGTPVIFGRAAVAADDILVRYCERESQTYLVDNSLSIIDFISRRCTAACARHLDAASLDGIRLGLREMLMNAMEHGNLGITFEEKTLATEKGNLLELIRTRQSDPRYNQRKVRVDYQFDRNGVEFKITDEGSGFDFQAMMERNLKSSTEIKRKHGRGIVLTRAMFDSVNYTSPGNEVRLTRKFDAPTPTTGANSSARNPT